MAQDRNLKANRPRVPETRHVRLIALKQRLNQIIKIYNIMAQVAKSLKQKRAESKYRVLQNATPDGKEIMSRLRNRTIQAHDYRDDAYTLDVDMVKASRMGKKDLIDHARKNQSKIDKLSNDLITHTRNKTQKEINPSQDPGKDQKTQ